MADDGVRVALYPGCLILQRMPEYERAARAVLGELGIETQIIQEAVCCGAPVAESFTADWVHLSIYNLALVERMGCDTVVTLCGSCTNGLTRASRALQDADLRAEANHRLQRASPGLAATDAVTVKHLVRLLAEREDDLRARIVRPLDLRVALTNPCQAFRPGEVMGAAGEDPMHPQAMRRLVELTGAEAVEYGESGDAENECCGATLYLAAPKLSLAAGQRKLEAAHRCRADLLLQGCGNSQLLLRNFQSAILRDAPNLRRPALFLPQLLGLAMGLPKEALGLREAFHL